MIAITQSLINTFLEILQEDLLSIENMLAIYNI